GGYFGDWLRLRTGNNGGNRRRIGFYGLCCASAFLVTSVACQPVWLAVLCTSVACFFASAPIPSWWAVVTGLSGKHLGALFGLLNSLGVPGAFASQIFVGRYADWMHNLGYRGRDQWDPMFYLYGGVLLIGAFGWLWVDPKRSVVEQRGLPLRARP